MAIQDNLVLEDRFAALDGGMNSRPVYSLLPKNQASLLVNATVRTGLAQCRPGFKPSPTLVFPDFDTETAFRTGLFQGAEFYQSFSGISCILASISGHIYMIRMDNFNVSDVTPVADPNSSKIPKVFFCQAEQYMLIQDGQAKCIIFDGASCRRANPEIREVPTGTAMAYGMGRLWVARGRNYVAGDIVGGATSVLQFQENAYIAGGGEFTVPLQSGVITAMHFIANLDTSLGQGALMVFTENGVFSVQVPADRLAWATTTNPIATVAQINYGSVSRFITPVNGDLFYRSQDGIRSLVISIRYFGQWANVPISTEMKNPLDNDDVYGATFASSTLFDNRMLMTTTPQKTPRGYAFQGLVALDFDLVSSLRQKLPPSYDGIWTGLKWLQFVRAIPERCFCFVVNADDEIDLWELTKSDRFDNTDTPIQWVIESPPFSWQNPQELKKLFYGDIWIDRLAGNVDFLVSYRPDHYFSWVDWVTFSRCANIKDCATGTCKTFEEFQEQYRPRIRFPQPPDTCEESLKKPYRQLYEMQIRLQMTGFCRVLSARMFANRLQEDPFGGCPGVEPCTTESGCTKKLYDYSAN